MTIRLHSALGGLVLGLLVGLPAHAGEYGAASLHLGSNGLGLGYAASVADNWSLRGQYNTLKASYSGNVGDFGSNSQLTVDLKLDALQLLGDWYPSSGGFRLSAGAVFNNNSISVSGRGQVNGLPALVNGEIKMSDGVSPYFGLGYGTRPREARGFGFTSDFGVMMQNPKVTLRATGPGITPQDVEAQRLKVQEAVDQLKLMPVFSVGISYAF